MGWTCSVDTPCVRAVHEEQNGTQISHCHTYAASCPSRTLGPLGVVIHINKMPSIIRLLSIEAWDDFPVLLTPEIWLWSSRVGGRAWGVSIALSIYSESWSVGTHPRLTSQRGCRGTFSKREHIKSQMLSFPQPAVEHVHRFYSPQEC